MIRMLALVWLACPYLLPSLNFFLLTMLAWLGPESLLSFHSCEISCRCHWLAVQVRENRLLTYTTSVLIMCVRTIYLRTYMSSASYLKACRGTKLDRGTSVADNKNFVVPVRRIPTLPDFLYMYSSAPGCCLSGSCLRNFRPLRMHALHRCGQLLQMLHVAWSVCWAHGWAV